MNLLKKIAWAHLMMLISALAVGLFMLPGILICYYHLSDDYFFIYIPIMLTLFVIVDDYD